MKKLLTVSFLLVLSFSFLNAQQASGASRTFTLEDLKKAAADAGFTVRDGRITQSNWTTKSISKAEPVDSFVISERVDGFNLMGVSILQHRTEAIASEYIEFHAQENVLYNPADIIYVDSIHRSGVFTVQINCKLKGEFEAKLMEVFRKAGWK